jgi:hypothetical protein
VVSVLVPVADFDDELVAVAGAVEGELSVRVVVDVDPSARVTVVVVTGISSRFALPVTVLDIIHTA